MVNLYIYAKDVSYSTDADEYYHTNGLNTVAQFKDDVERIKKEAIDAGEDSAETKIVYLHWCDDCQEVSEEATIAAYNKKAAKHSGTQPASIILSILGKYIKDKKKDKIKLLYIITDGLIDHKSAERCFHLNRKLHYENFVFHAFNKNVNQIDLSVAASFFKSRCTVYRNNDLYDSVNLSEEYDYDKINIENYATAIDDLKSYIKLKFIKKQNKNARSLHEIDKLKKLRNRLFKEFSIKKDSEKCKVNLETKDRNVFLSEFINLDWYKNLNDAMNDEKVKIEKCISSMINYIVSDTKSYSFDVLKFDKEFDKPIEEEQIDNDIEFSVEQEIKFPDVILDDEKGIPVVILTQFNLMKKIIFHEKQKCTDKVTPASFSKFKSSMDCPLYLIKDKDVSESIGYFYTLNVYKQLLANNTNKEPRTRRPFHGGLVLTDTDQFDKYNDYILSATYFDFKKVSYNIGLFYFVLWKNCENKEWMDRNVVEQFKKYTMRRISETVCKIGLSSLPLDPQENTSLLSALWYCVELSSCIFKNDDVHFNHERLRMYYGVAPYMIEILKYFNYNLDLGSIEKRRELISHVMILKRIPKYRDRVYYLLESIFKTVDGFLVSEIEKPYNSYRLNYLKLDHKSILHDNIISETINLNDYIHLMHAVGDLKPSNEITFENENTYEICDKTFRPFFTIDQNKSFYTELVKNTRKVKIINSAKDNFEVTYETIESLQFDRILSLYKLFHNCVDYLRRYPTLPEYVEFVSRKKKFNDKYVTIFPTNVYFSIKGVYKRYENIMKSVAVEEFIKVSKTYTRRNDRIKAEERVNFQSDDEIGNFISSEESKVKLIKKR